LKTSKKGVILTGIIPKCLENNGKAFIGSDGTLWPCCWIYTLGHELKEWATKNDCDIDDINLNKYTIDEIKNSKLMTQFNQSFDTDVCRRECGEQSWKNNNNTKRGDYEVYR